MTFCDTAVGIGAKFWTHAQKEERWRMEGETGMEVDLVFNGVPEKGGLDKFPTMLKINIFERMFHNNFILQYFLELR